MYSQSLSSLFLPFAFMFISYFPLLQKTFDMFSLYGNVRVLVLNVSVIFEVSCFLVLLSAGQTLRPDPAIVCINKILTLTEKGSHPLLFSSCSPALSAITYSQSFSSCLIGKPSSEGQESGNAQKALGVLVIHFIFHFIQGISFKYIQLFILKKEKHLFSHIKNPLMQQDFTESFYSFFGLVVQTINLDYQITVCN